MAGVTKDYTYPINKNLCKTCKYRHVLNSQNGEIYTYQCNYMYITGHHKPTLETDGGNVCGCYEKK